MMKKVCIYIVLFLLFLGGIIFYNMPDEKKTYLLQKYLKNYDFQKSLQLDMIHRDKVAFHYLLTHKEELKDAGGIEAQLSLAIYESNHTFMNILFNKYKVNIVKLLEHDAYLLNHLLREGYIDFFEKLVLSLEEKKRISILKKVLKSEMDEFFENKSINTNFLNDKKRVKTFLLLSNIKKDDNLLLFFLNKSAGFSKIYLVEVLLEYGVPVNKEDLNSISPLMGLFIYTPAPTVKPFFSSLAFDKDLEEVNLLLEWYMKKNKITSNSKKSVFNNSQKRIFRIHLSKKREIYKLLLELGADPYQGQIDGEVPFDLFNQYGQGK